MEAHDDREVPFRIRFRVPLTLLPPVIGLAVAIALWGRKGEPEFFSAATEVLALGAVALALQGRFFRLATHQHAGLTGAYVMFNVLFVLISIGVGLYFAFRPLATGEVTDADLALTSGALAAGVAAFAVQALFGTPGMEDESE